MNMKLYSIIIVLLFLVSPVAASYDYTETGTVQDDGDLFLDEDEVQFIKFVLKPGETLEAEFISYDGFLNIMYCKCNKKADISNIMGYNILSRDRVGDYFVLDNSTSEAITFSYKSDSRLAGHIAIFSPIYNFDTGEKSFELNTNIPSGPRGISPLALGIAAGVIILGILIYRSRKGDTEDDIDVPDSEQTTQTKNSQEKIQTQSEGQGSVLVCGVCGNANPGNSSFCRECGTKL